MYATCIDTCSTLIYINYIHIQVRGGGGSGPPGPPPCVRPCMSWSCDPASISEVGVSSCCCTGELCNYVSMVMATPLPGEGVW